MVDITIHRCTLRIVRHGGWGWGPEPRKLLQLAIKALPELLEAELAKLWPDDVELEFNAPVSLNVPLRLSELTAATSLSGAFNSSQIPPELETLGRRIGAAATKAFLNGQGASAETRSPETRAIDVNELPLTPSRDKGNAVFEVLRSWYQEGVLSQRLSVFSVTALQSWFDRLAEKVTTPVSRQQPRPATPHTRRQVTDPRSGEIDFASDIDSQSLELDARGSEMIERLFEAGALSSPKSFTDRAATLRRRLMILTDVMVQLDISQCTEALLATLDRLLPLPDRTKDAQSNRTPVAGGQVAEGIETLRADNESEFSTSNVLFEWQQTSATSKDSSGNSSDSSLTAASRQQVESERLKTVREETSTSDLSSDQVSETWRSPAPSPAKTHSLSLHQEVTRASFYPGVRKLSGTESRPRVVSALPFMLLGPLSRIGYLKALAATMEAADAVAASPLFAAALAYKVLAPPARGWRREPDSINAATRFAGLNSAAPEPSLVQLARHLAEHLSPLDAVLAGALIGGHKQQEPVLLLRAGENADSGFLLLDVEGAFAIQWAASVADLHQVLIQVDSSLILVPQNSADPKLLRWLDDEGFQFVTDAIPVRGEDWRRLRRQQERWWTNDAFRSDSSIIKAARLMSEAAVEAATIWDALNVQRPSVPLADDWRLDRHLTLAASTALGTIAWELWRAREPTSPLLALERFCDFEALVTWKREEVRVSLPLGKRFQDLRDHGLLDDVSDVPWFNGRTLVFSSD